MTLRSAGPSPSRRERGRLVARIKFASDVYAFAAPIEKLVAAGYLRATSVGFRPLEPAAFDQQRGGYNYSKVELLEVCVVPIPANAHALIEGAKAFAPMQPWAVDTLRRYPPTAEEGEKLIRITPGPPPKIKITPSVVRDAVVTAVKAEVRRLRGRLD